MKQPGRPFSMPFQIFLLTLILAAFGLVMVYSSSASYAATQRRTEAFRRVRDRLVSEALAGDPHYLEAGLAEKRRMRLEAGKRVSPEARQVIREQMSDDHAYHDSRYALRQFLWFAIGLVGMFAAYHVDYQRLKTLAPLLLIGSFALLLLVFVPGLGRPINDHRRWIVVAGFTFQPSEAAKLALIIYMARMLTNQHDRIQDFRSGVMPALVVTGALALAIILEPDIGAAGVLMAITFCMWFIGGMRIMHLAGLVAAIIPAFAYVVWRFPDRLARIFGFLSDAPEALSGPRYQLEQSLVAIGSGGMLGTGLGNSIQKYFLTEQFSDFIFAIVAEEMGFIGAAAIVCCYFLLMWQGWRVALRSPDFFSALLASGITLMLAINVVLNLMVVLGMMPTTGLVCPLLSYGGSNMLITMISLGILMNVAKYIERQTSPRRGVARRARSSASPTRQRSGRSRASGGRRQRAWA